MHPRKNKNLTNKLIIMKKHLSFIYFVSWLLLSFTMASCSDSDNSYTDVDGLSPTINLTLEKIQTEPGRQFVIEGDISDKDGIKSIHLLNEKIYLDKVINLSKDTITYNFKLEYKFTSEKDFTQDDVFEIKVIVTDFGGRTTEKNLTLTMDGDFNAPTFTIQPAKEITVLIKNETKYKLNFIVEDDKALDKVLVAIPELSYSKEFTNFESNSKIFEYVELLTIPSVEKAYSLTITAVDKSNHETTINSIITVSDMPDFPKMYLVDVDTKEEMINAVMGVPMLIERTTVYTYKARYYSTKAGSKVRFVPQKNDFEPICFGTNPDDIDKLADDPEVSQAIELPEIGYYEIKFNIQSGNYTVNKYTPTDEYVPVGSMMNLNGPGSDQIPLQIGLIGKGWPNDAGGNPASILVLTQQTDNKYLFSAEVTFAEATEIKDFIISTGHSWGWWPEPYWRWDKTDDPEVNILNGGENGTVMVKKAGKYIVEFDTHLLRTRFYPIN